MRPADSLMGNADSIARYLGAIPNRLQLAGGWIDQPFVSRHNPQPPGSMVVVQIEPNFRPMDRSGLASGTRAIAMKLWPRRLPQGARSKLVRELYAAENKGKAEPSGSQDMIGLVYPGINRLDYDFRVEGGVFPAHIESLYDPRAARWLESVLHLLPVEPRPEGYSPLGEKHLDPKWVARLGQSGRDCFAAIQRRDVSALGAAFNLTMRCWETLLPQVVRHPLIRVDLPGLLQAYQKRYAGAMYSGCGGGYLIVAAAEPVPGSFSVNVRIKPGPASGAQSSSSALRLPSQALKPEMSAKPTVVVSGGFDGLRARQVRWLEEAAQLGELTVLLWPDETLQRQTGEPPGCLLAERLYLLRALRYVTRVIPLAAPLDINTLPKLERFQPRIWVDEENPGNAARQVHCDRHGLEYRVVPTSFMLTLSAAQPVDSVSDRKKVVVTGCYDWFHSGHVRFFEEVSAYGDLYVVVGHDANIRLLKGEAHPMFPQEERRYLVGSIKYVKQALISSGEGWLDADPEIRRLKPDIYAVNQDGDRGGKREYCAKLGLEYLVLKRTPAPGLPPRTSTDLRGF